ncbi:hypothetical protein Goarm_023380, partial [Gossypium armourianum]|nr:hypothetical protein [Gossypium armourianum]
MHKKSPENTQPKIDINNQSEPG